MGYYLYYVSIWVRRGLNYYYNRTGMLLHNLKAQPLRCVSHFMFSNSKHSKYLKSSLGINQVCRRNSFGNFLFRPRYAFSEMENEGSKKKAMEQKFNKMTEQKLAADVESDIDAVSYTKSENKTIKYLIGITALGLVAVYVMMEVQTIRAQKKIDKSITGIAKVSSTGKVQIGGPWKLIDVNGKPFGSEDLQGTYYLIYFGFTNCPDICPNSLIKLSRAVEKIKKMPEYQYISLKTVFVSVDPDRDSMEKIKKFMSYFDPSMIGVTGTSNNDENLREAMKKFKIYSSKIEFEDEDTVKQGRKSYTIDHTILTYLMSDSNDYLVHLGANLGDHEMAKMIMEKIIENENNKMRMIKNS